ncbi:potassium transporter [Alicycliphilus sp. B1]|nr:potassium transporter [Alicycliphilus sp. B1]
MAFRTLGAIGVVYGDIGTSVLYTLKEVFGSGHVPFTHANVYGVLSIVFWTLTIIVSLKYVVLVLRADNNGEGGLVAMLALASQSVKDKAPALRKWMLAIGIFGTCLFYGDGVITPAITGAVGGGGPGRGLAHVPQGGDTAHAADPAGTVPAAKARHGGHRPVLRAGSWCSGSSPSGRWASTTSRATRRSCSP